MREIIVSANEAGQRFDKLLAKYLNEAPKSFLYKMLRKKNIVLNGKKATGNEKLVVGDRVKFFLSEDTIEKFSRHVVQCKKAKLDVLYEDEHVIFINKPVGMLSQKAKPQDTSLVEYLISYLLESGQLTKEELKSFRPSICNRLDRNTSGLVAAGKSLVGLQQMGELFKSRTLKKYYLTLVKGEVKKEQHIKGFLRKNEATNTVNITGEKEADNVPIETEYKPLFSNGKVTLLEVHLITGRTHQIRAHLSSIGHPVIGDYKYGNRKMNQIFQEKYGLKSQFLHAYRIEMPVMEGELNSLSEKQIIAPLPKQFARILKEEKITKDDDYGNMEFQGT